MREALTKAKELMMLEPDERLVIGTVYCVQNPKTGEILELVPAEDYLEIGGVVMLRLLKCAYNPVSYSIGMSCSEFRSEMLCKVRKRRHVT